MSTPAEKAKRLAAYEEIKDKVKPAPEFGEGWMVLEVVRLGGKQAGHTDRYWFSPNERFRIRSKAEFKRFQLALEAAPRNDEDLAWSILKSNNKSTPPGGSSSAAISGPDAGAGHPSSAKPAAAGTAAATSSNTHASTKKKKQKIQTSRKAQGKGVPLSRGYIPTITSVRGAAPDGPYIDEDEVSRVYNYPKDIARRAELEEKGFYEPELAGADGDDDDGDADGAPYRHITNWFLAKPSAAGASFGVHRTALPADYRKVKNLCLYGELLPSPRKVARARTKGRDPPKPQPVVLRRLLLWSIDRDFNDRGIWIQTSDAWYKLEQPCTARVYNGKSQDDVHLELRAKFGLVSNLLDMFNEKSKSLKLENFFGLHDSRTPSESLNVLTPSPGQLERHPMLPTEPFDMELLRREATFVKQHIQDCGVGFAKSNFVKGLTEMEKEWKKTHKDKKKGGGEFDYLASAEAAEKRSGRRPWGSLITYRGGSHDGVPRINRLVEIKVDESKNSEEMQKTPAKKTKLSPSSSDQRPAKKKKKLESSKKTAPAKGRAASPAPSSVTKVVKVKKAPLGGMPETKASVKGGTSSSGSKGRGETQRTSAKKAPTTAEKIKAARLVSGRGPANTEKKIRTSPTIAPPAAAVPTAAATTSRKRALSDSDDSIFSNSSEEDEWKPTSTAAESKTKRVDAEEVEESFVVQDPQLHPILIFQVKNKCANKIRAFVDAAGKVIDKRADVFIKSCVIPNPVSSYEFMLAVVESLKVSPPSVLELLFDRKNPKKCGARRIFVTWLDAAKKRMEERRNDPIQKAILDAVGDNAKTEEELASHILMLSRKCFDPSTTTSVMTPKQAMKTCNIDIVEITRKVRNTPQFISLVAAALLVSFIYFRAGYCPPSLSHRFSHNHNYLSIKSLQFKSFAEEAGATKLVTVCTAHIEVYKAANGAGASPSDAFGKALAGAEEPSSGSKNALKNDGTSAARTSDSVDYKKVGKAAAVMANVKRSNSGESSKSNGSNVSGAKAIKSGGTSLGSALLSELMAARSSMKKAKAGMLAQSGAGNDRSTPVEEGKD